jgi:hypothetical protein
MAIESITFETLQDLPPDFDRWKMRVILRGENFEVRSVPLVITVGELNVEMIVPLVSDEGPTGVQGYLTEIPEIGSEVQVGYADGTLISTGFEFSENSDV